jgi:serine/threonine-protein kinase HipA
MPAASTTRPGFRSLGKRMLQAWAEGVRGLRDDRVYAMGNGAPSKDS